MRQLFSRLLPTLALFALAGCATPVTAYNMAVPDAVQSEVARQEAMVQAGMDVRESRPSPSARFPMSQRVMAIAERVFIAAAPYCGWQTTAGYPVTVGVIGRGQPQIINAAGRLRPGDVVLGILGQDVPDGRAGYEMLNEIGGQAAQRRMSLPLTVARGNQVLTETYEPIAECALPVKLVRGDEWNAYTDGEALYLYTKLVQDLPNDDDLAFTMAHEMSHALLGHVQKSQQNAMTGALFGMAIEAAVGSNSGEFSQMGASLGQMQYSQEFEHEADYMGLYLLANAGYDLMAGPRVARRIAQQSPESIRYGTDHPSSAARAASLMSTIQEIKAKQSAGQPLSPSMRQK